MERLGDVVAFYANPAGPKGCFPMDEINNMSTGGMGITFKNKKKWKNMKLLCLGHAFFLFTYHQFQKY